MLVAAADCIAVGVDVPIGLPSIGRRPCDTAAAARLGPARSSVFPAPVRTVLTAPGYAAACAASRAATGAAISRQAWNIAPKIGQWDAVEVPPHVVEVHPELSFRALAPETTFAPKKAARGAAQRIAALARALPLDRALARPPAGAGLDDVLDALAAAWSAARWSAGRAEVLGGEPDQRGRPMRMVI